MAATWDTALERAVGTMVGREARSKGVQIMLAPGVNIQRAPMCGRNFEYFGEDPFLAGKMAASYVKGVQSQGVVATIKHYALNNEEYDRQTVSSDADERTMQEIYLPAFKAAVTEGHIGSVMCSYNLVNGEHAANSTHLLTDILKNQFKFDGFVMSDWGAVHNGVASVTAGLDLEMWAGEHMTLDTLLPALKDGRITQAMIDDKIRRILRIMFRFGFFDRDQNVFNLEVSDGPDPRPEAHAAALQAAREGIVLLKNTGILPLDRSRIKQIAVIGPNAHPAVTGGGGSSHISPDHTVSVFDGVSTLAGSGIAVNYLPGIVPVTDSVFSTSTFTAPDGKTPGLQGSYFSNQNLKGAPAFTQIDTHIKFDYHGDLRPGFPMEHFSVRWQGTLSVSHDDDFELIVAGDDGYRLFLDGKLVIDDWQDQGTTTNTASVHLLAGSTHAVTLEYYQGGGAANIAFGYQPVSAMLSPRVHDVAANADAVVLCVGYNENTESEGADRTFELPSEQLRLIHEVASANPHTIVVLNAGGNVAMSQWIDNVPALLHAWYPGQEGGTALAEIIFGDVNPSGKLPVSFEKRWEDNATYKSYYADTTKHLKYSEGVFLGYRHFDQANIEPMFPFGFGLSYTTFQCANLAVASGENDSRSKIVTFDVTNTGTRAGDEIEQVYVHQENPGEPRPPKELKGFVRVSLKPGETKTAKLVLHESAFSYFSAKQNTWVVEPGQFQILVGPSSRALALKKSITLN
jgi:beta-glucosidase